MTLLDGLGQWNNLGTITPNYSDWLQYPEAAVSGFTTFRVSFSGDWFVGGWHWIYLRESYATSSGNIEGKWVRVYPSDSPKIFYIYSSPEFGYLNPQRNFQIKKSHRYLKTYGGSFADKIFSVKLEEFSPYPELLEQEQKQTLTEETIRLIAQEVVKLLPSAES